MTKMKKKKRQYQVFAKKQTEGMLSNADVNENLHKHLENLC